MHDKLFKSQQILKPKEMKENECEWWHSQGTHDKVGIKSVGFWAQMFSASTPSGPSLTKDLKGMEAS